jgi:type IV pilus assembly protein PilE
MMATSPQARSAGFTLVELMITLVIAAILLAIAIPTYQAEVQKSRRTDAKTALLDLAAREQRVFSVENTFTSSFGDLGYAAAGSSPASVTVGSGYYTVTVTTNVANPPGFLLTAQTTGTQTADTACAQFTVDNTGLQKAYDSSSNDNTTTCWQ